MKPWALVAVGMLLAGCAESLPEVIELQPAGEEVEFAYEPPSAAAYKEVAKVVGTAEGVDLEAALAAAKNDLRNKAAAVGAAVVTIDENVGVAMPLSRKMKVKLVGRAYKPVD